jgi:hypothetical protein
MPHQLMTRPPAPNAGGDGAPVFVCQGRRENRFSCLFSVEGEHFSHSANNNRYNSKTDRVVVVV